MLVKMLDSVNVGLNNVQIYLLQKGEIYDLPKWHAAQLINSSRGKDPTSEDLNTIVQEANQLAEKEVESRAPVTQLPSSSFTDQAKAATVEPVKDDKEAQKSPEEPKSDSKKSRTFVAEEPQPKE